MGRMPRRSWLAISAAPCSTEWITIRYSGDRELGLAGLGVRRGRLCRAPEDRLGPGDQLLLPAVDQRRVDAVVTGQFVDGAVPLVGGQGDLGLERRRVDLPLRRHRYPSSGPPV